jgi:hypothetical protein
MYENVLYRRCRGRLGDIGSQELGCNSSDPRHGPSPRSSRCPAIYTRYVSKKPAAFLRVVPSAIVQLCRTRVAVTVGLLHVFGLRTVLKCRGDEGRAHGVRRVAAVEPERRRVFPHDAINRVGCNAPALVLTLAVVLERPEEPPLDVGAMPGGVEVGANACGCLRIDRQRVAPRLRVTRKEAKPRLSRRDAHKMPTGQHGQHQLCKALRAPGRKRAASMVPQRYSPLNKGDHR